MLGGRTNHWGRISLRNGPYDFKPYSRDGLGLDWPISYEDVAPYYDKVEMLIGVYGSNEGLENTPNSSEGVLLPPPKARAGELLAQQRAKKLGLPVIPIHRAVLSVKQDAERIPAKLHPQNPTAQRILAQAMRDRAACFWATQCGRGCSIKANYQSTTVHLPPALATGNLDILPNAMVREITMDENGKATGVIYIDRVTGEAHALKARVVRPRRELRRVRAHSAQFQIPALPQRPRQLQRPCRQIHHGHRGRAPRRSRCPLLENMPAHNEDGAGGAHMYVPWWLYQEQKAGKLDFARGYHIEFQTGRSMPGLGAATAVAGLTEGSYGRKFKEDARRYYGTFVSFAGRGEMIPNADSYCDLDPTVKDKWGTPVLRFHWKWSDHETRQAAHMQRTFAEIITAMGGKPNKLDATGLQAIEPGGKIIHEVGGTIMGADPKKSVTNQWGQTWDVKNIFVNDGGPFASNADKNPTLTIMALAWRASDYLLAEMKKGNL